MHVPQLERVVGRPRPGLRALGLRSRRAADARQRRRRPAAGGGHAVVHDGVRARHDHHVPADARLRARARAHRAARAGRAAGRARRSEHRRRARQDHPRAAPRARGRGLVPALLRHASTPRRCFSCCSRRPGAGRATTRSCASSSPRCACALRWIDEFGDLDGDGFVEFLRRSDHGLAVQSWKDSPDSQRFADGRIAEGPVAASEVQGYVYDAKLPLRRARARGARRRARWPSGWSARRAELRERFDRAFWVERNGGFYALALDGAQAAGRQPLLEHGASAVERDRAGRARGRRRAHACSEPPLWSGWGVRTMSAEDEAYRPLAYHNGTVWPHDNSLIAHGLALRGEFERVAADPAQHARGLALLRRRPARGVRRAGAPRHAVPRRLSDRLAPAGLGGGRARAAAARPARPRARSRTRARWRCARSGSPSGPET